MISFFVSRNRSRSKSGKLKLKKPEAHFLEETNTYSIPGNMQY